MEEVTNPPLTPPPGDGLKLRTTAPSELRSAAAQQAKTIATEAKDKAQKLKTVAAEKAQTIKSNVSEKAQVIKQGAGEKAQVIKAKGKEQWDQGKIKAKEVHTSAEDYVRAKPTQCVLGALGVGFLLGLIVRR